MTSRIIPFHACAPLSQLLCATTRIGSMHTPGGIAAAVSEEHGTAEKADLILAAARRWAEVTGDRELLVLCDLLDGGDA